MFEDIKKYINPKSPLFQFGALIGIYTLFLTLSLVWIEFENKAKNANWTNTFLIYTLINFSITLGVPLLLYILNYTVFKMKGFNLLDIGITSCIVFLVAHPTNSPLFILLALVASIGLKFVFRSKGKPVFNPAALGLLTAFYLTFAFNPENYLFISWWGANAGKTIPLFALHIPILPLVFIPACIAVVIKFRKHLYGWSFFLTYLLTVLLFYSIDTGSISSGINSVISITRFSLFTWLFMIFVMVVEPKTSPTSIKHQIVLGAIGALLYFGLQRINLVSLPAEITTILLLNLLTLLFFSPAALIKTTTTTTTIKTQ